MKHALPITIATIAVFSFMGIVISSGELRLQPPKAPDRTLLIRSASVGCETSPEATQPKLNVLLGALCNGKATCEVDTQPLSAFYNVPDCAETVKLVYDCISTGQPEAKTKEKPYTAFLYEGQHVTLGCNNGPVFP